jgi:hypothetical protein
MTRFFLAVALGLSFSSTCFAQDMPLSQILIDGEGWKKVEQPGAKAEPAPKKHITYSPDRSTMFLALPIPVRYLHASPRNAAGGYGPFAPYAPLRTRRGETMIAVTSLTTDKDGRIYAATEIGAQVFDPTGRLCGVLTPAAPGKPEAMAFEGDKLTLWIGETKYARKLNTSGMK